MSFVDDVEKGMDKLAKRTEKKLGKFVEQPEKEIGKSLGKMNSYFEKYASCRKKGKTAVTCKSELANERKEIKRIVKDISD